MIDLHSHVIPGIDDGAKSWEEAIAMCRMAQADGTELLVATPHMFNGLYQPSTSSVTKNIDLLKKRLRSERIGLEVMQGAEVHACPDLPLLLKEEPKLTLNGKSRYFLLEFPHSVIPPGADQFVFQLVIKNLIPIVAHPERNLYVQRNVKLLEHLLQHGAICQVTAMSFTGGFGPRARECAYELLRRNLVHVVASDAHNITGRPPHLSEARKAVQECVGSKRARELFETHPRKILNGEI